MRSAFGHGAAHQKADFLVGSLGHRNRLGLKGTDPREHPREGFVDRKQRGHRAHTLTPVISVIVPVHDEERSVALLHDELASALDKVGL